MSARDEKKPKKGNEQNPTPNPIPNTPKKHGIGDDEKTEPKKPRAINEAQKIELPKDQKRFEDSKGEKKSFPKGQQGTEDDQQNQFGNSIKG